MVILSSKVLIFCPILYKSFGEKKMGLMKKKVKAEHIRTAVVRVKSNY